ncbi:hypothetical protein ABZS83_17435 [Streptomyces sp. NPDC005426]|uniref:hypothetical protein n=1 Tax=Streptomyces sp. NPDC005426 TaxID=3155344 RepID=UPI0033ABD6A8
MDDELPASRAFLRSVDWSRLEHGGGSAAPGTPMVLAGLAHDSAPDAAARALRHLWDDLLHQGSLYSATPKAAVYVAAVLGESHGDESSMSSRHEIELLEWLAEVAYAVSVSRERQLKEWFGPEVMERNPLFGEVRAIRPLVFTGVHPYISDAHTDVVEAALLAATHLLDAPELAACIDVLAPDIRDVLGVSSKQGYRDAAISALAAWGENVESLTASTESTEEGASWNEFWNSDRGPVDNPPF